MGTVSLDSRSTKGHPKLIFEVPDMAANGGLREMNRLSCFGEAAPFNDSAENGKLPEVHSVMPAV